MMMLAFPFLFTAMLQWVAATKTEVAFTTTLTLSNIDIANFLSTGIFNSMLKDFADAIEIDSSCMSVGGYNAAARILSDENIAVSHSADHILRELSSSKFTRSLGTLSINLNIAIIAEDYGFTSDTAYDAYNWLTGSISDVILSGTLQTIITEKYSSYSELVVEQSVQFSNAVVTDVTDMSSSEEYHPVTLSRSSSSSSSGHTSYHPVTLSETEKQTEQTQLVQTEPESQSQTEEETQTETEGETETETQTESETEIEAEREKATESQETEMETLSEGGESNSKTESETETETKTETESETETKTEMESDAETSDRDESDSLDTTQTETERQTETGSESLMQSDSTKTSVRNEESDGASVSDETDSESGSETVTERDNESSQLEEVQDTEINQDTQEYCFSQASTLPSSSMLIMNGQSGQNFVTQVNQHVSLQFNWYHTTGTCESCQIQLYMGISGYDTDSCADAYGSTPKTYYLKEKFQFSSSGCYLIFATEQYGSLCSLYSMGPVNSGNIIGSVWVEDVTSTTSVVTIGSGVEVSSDTEGTVSSGESVSTESSMATVSNSLTGLETQSESQTETGEDESEGATETETEKEEETETEEETGTESEMQTETEGQEEVETETAAVSDIETETETEEIQSGQTDGETQSETETGEEEEGEEGKEDTEREEETASENTEKVTQEEREEQSETETKDSGETEKEGETGGQEERENERETEEQRLTEAQTETTETKEEGETEIKEETEGEKETESETETEGEKEKETETDPYVESQSEMNANIEEEEREEEEKQQEYAKEEQEEEEEREEEEEEREEEEGEKERQEEEESGEVTEVGLLQDNVEVDESERETESKSGEETKAEEETMNATETKKETESMSVAEGEGDEGTETKMESDSETGKTDDVKETEETETKNERKTATDNKSKKVQEDEEIVWTNPNSNTQFTSGVTSVTASDSTCQQCIMSVDYSQSLQTVFPLSETLTLYGYSDTWAGYGSSGARTTYQITDVSGSTTYYMGQLCSSSSSSSSADQPCSLQLTAGQYTWHVTGGDSEHRDEVAWDFCGRHGGASSVMVFTVASDGTCSPEDYAMQSTAAEEYSRSQKHSSSPLEFFAQSLHSIETSAYKVAHNTTYILTSIGIFGGLILAVLLGVQIRRYRLASIHDTDGDSIISLCSGNSVPCSHVSSICSEDKEKKKRSKRSKKSKKSRSGDLCSDTSSDAGDRDDMSSYSSSTNPLSISITKKKLSSSKSDMITNNLELGKENETDEDGVLPRRMRNKNIHSHFQISKELDNDYFDDAMRLHNLM